MQVRQVNLCIVYGNGDTFESTCSNDEFATKFSNKLKAKEVIGYIKEFVGTDSISFFIKQCGGLPFDFFRLKEFNYYVSRMWKYKKVDKEVFDLCLKYLCYEGDDKVPGGRKFILKKVERIIK